MVVGFANGCINIGNYIDWDSFQREQIKLRSDKNKKNRVRSGGMLYETSSIELILILSVVNGKNSILTKKI